jgi:hypothetical protein
MFHQVIYLKEFILSCSNAIILLSLYNLHHERVFYFSLILHHLLYKRIIWFRIIVTSDVFKV